MLIHLDQNGPSVSKDLEILSPVKSVDGGAGRKHVFTRKEVLVTRKRMATSNKSYRTGKIVVYTIMIMMKLRNNSDYQ